MTWTWLKLTRRTGCEFYFYRVHCKGVVEWWCGDRGVISTEGRRPPAAVAVRSYGEAQRLLAWLNVPEPRASARAEGVASCQQGGHQ